MKKNDELPNNGPNTINRTITVSGYPIIITFDSLINQVVKILMQFITDTRNKMFMVLVCSCTKVVRCIGIKYDITETGYGDIKIGCCHTEICTGTRCGCIEIASGGIETRRG
eukprot:99216_1